MYSWWQRLNSLRHRIGFGLSERLRWSRGAHYETPALELKPATAEQGERIAALQTRYQVKFERRLNAATSLNNYEYLDILDRASQAFGLSPPRGGDLCDVGCANFWYAPALHAFFRPDRMVGVEVEAYRRYRDGHARIDYARGYIEHLPRTKLLIADYANSELPADVITAWFPFVTPAAILAWRLPLSLLRPERLLQRVRANLRSGGAFFMVNHGLREAAVAHSLCVAAGMRSRGVEQRVGLLSGHRPEPAVLSLWT